MECSGELSEGELVDEEQQAKDESSNSMACSQEENEGIGEEDTGEPKSKRQKILEVSTSSKDEDSGGEWQTLSKRQLKKMTKRKQREKKKHQELEDKYASMTTQPSDNYLNARQSDVLRSLLQIYRGQRTNLAMVQKLKTVQFQNIVSHLVIGYPPLNEELLGLDKLKNDYKVVVIWLSMVSANFFKKSPSHFPKLKKLNPCVMFDIEHPGSARFVKLGLESFMMLLGKNSNSPSSTSTPSDPDLKPPPLCSYLFSSKDLTEHDFPNPTQGDVDKQGRVIREYASIMEWPSCDISESPRVLSAMQGEEEMKMFAIDCEMVETGNGSELARVSVVNENLECIYDTFVKPDSPIIDYRTKYSGITESSLDDVTTTLKDVQLKLSSLIPPDSVLIGHSLENDFHALKFRHPYVVDTSCIFTPLATPTAKPGLRRLCKELLLSDIQNTDKGHSSVEDATACMKLVKMKLKEGDNCKISFNEIAPSIFTEYRTKGCTTGIIDKDSVIRLFGKGSDHSADVKSDEEAVVKSIEIMPLSKFTFIQLHDMENLFKQDNPVDEGDISEAAKSVDDNIIRIVENSPQKSIIFIVCGSSNIRKVRSIQQEDYPDPHLLKKEVMLARTGCVLGVMVG